jgi:hypothetical protein
VGWKHWVRLLSLLVTAIAALANAVVAAMRNNAVAVQVVAYLATIACGALLVVLVGCFVSSMLFKSRDAVLRAGDQGNTAARTPNKESLNLVKVMGKLRKNNMELTTELESTRNELSQKTQSLVTLQRAYDALRGARNNSGSQEGLSDSKAERTAPASTTTILGMTSNMMRSFGSGSALSRGGGHGGSVDMRTSYEPERTRRSHKDRGSHTTAASPAAATPPTPRTPSYHRVNDDGHTGSHRDDDDAHSHTLHAYANPLSAIVVRSRSSGRHHTSTSSNFTSKPEEKETGGGRGIWT